MRQQMRKWAVWAMALGAILLANVARGERPTAAQLLPQDTLAYVRVADSRELVKRFNETAMGRIGQDEQIRPLVGQLYGTMTQAFAEVEDEIGLPLDKILALPQGEMCFAVTSPAAGPPAMFLLIEAGDQLPSIQKLLQKAEDAATGRGFAKTVEVVGDAKITTLKMGDGVRDQIIYLEKDGVFLAATEPELLKQVLGVWNGVAKDQKVLIDEAKFVTVMSRCQGGSDDPPQFTWYVDPIRLAKVASRGNVGAQTAIALLPAVGLDGLQAIGGSLAMASGEFDSISHLHIMIDEPRSGVLEAIAITNGDTTPEAWVPADIASYLTINFDVERSYDAISKVYNSIAGEAALQNQVDRNINDRLEVDFQKDLLAACAGRFTTFSWIEKPIRLDSQANVLGVKLKDPEAFQATFDKLTTKYQDNLVKTSYGATTYWMVKLPEAREGVEAERRERRVRLMVRPPQPSFAIFDGYLLVADRPGVLERAIIAAQDRTESLAKDLEFKLIMSKIKRQPGGETPGMIAFSRPEEGMRMMYDLVQGEQAKTFLANRAERSPFLKNVDQAMKDNPLPPFAVIQKYLAPSGGLLTSDETGIHYAGFQLRRK